MKRITQADVAEYCGVARTTVSAVFRNTPNIPPATAERIRTAAAELGYVPELQQAARRLILHRYGSKALNRSILLVLPPFYHKAQFFSRLVDGVQDVMFGEGVLPIICSSDLLTNATMQTLPSLIACGEFDGILYHGSAYCAVHTLAPMLTATLGQHAMPVVAMMAKDEEYASIHVDDRLGMYLATRHLLELGHTHILLCLQPWGLDFWQDRIAGVTLALQQAGLDPATHLHHSKWYFGNIIPPHHLAVADVPYSSDDDRAFLAHEHAEFLTYLDTYPEVTAIISLNDAIARRIAYLLKRSGRRVPADISVVGFDDCDPLLDDEGRNCLTSVHVPLEEIGATAARKLLAWIHGTLTSPPHTIVAPTLTVRQSTAPSRR